MIYQRTMFALLAKNSDLGINVGFTRVSVEYRLKGKQIMPYPEFLDENDRQRGAQARYNKQAHKQQWVVVEDSETEFTKLEFSLDNAPDAYVNATIIQYDDDGRECFGREYHWSVHAGDGTFALEHDDVADSFKEAARAALEYYPKLRQEFYKEQARREEE